ncbi:hypothetical protein BHE74_00021124 [Ensete ventricosum]|nr:hypothetical protein BHE74_00021124 [Ensete ventricosum]
MPGSNSLRQQRLASNRAVRCLPVPANPCSTPGRPARLFPVLTLNDSSSSSSWCAILARPLSRNSTSATFHCPSLPFPSFLLPCGPTSVAEFRAAVRSGTHLGLLSPPTLKSTLFLHSSGISTFHLHTRRFPLIPVFVSICEVIAQAHYSNLLIMTNLSCSLAHGRWEDVAEARKMLKCTGVKKEPGHSFIEVKGITEKFTDLIHNMPDIQPEKRVPVDADEEDGDPDGNGDEDGGSGVGEEGSSDKDSEGHGNPDDANSKEVPGGERNVQSDDEEEEPEDQRDDNDDDKEEDDENGGSEDEIKDEEEDQENDEEEDDEEETLRPPKKRKK